MIHLTEQEFKIVVDILNRAPMTSGEAYAITSIVNKAQVQVDANKKEPKPKAD